MRFARAWPVAAKRSRWPNWLARCLAPGVLVVALAGLAPAAMALDGAALDELLRRADTIKSANYTEFSTLVDQLAPDSERMSTEQRQFFQYLQAWKAAYVADYDFAVPVLKGVFDESTDSALRVRAAASLVNVFSISRRYEEAFQYLSRLTEMLPSVKDRAAREFGLLGAALLHNEVGRYELGLGYAEQLLKESDGGRNYCIGQQMKLQALYKLHRLAPTGSEVQDGIDACVRRKEYVFADLIRTYVARIRIEGSQFADAIALLRAHYDEVQETHYPRLISEYDALLAQAHWEMGDRANARRYAQRAIERGVQKELTEPLVAAYRLLYLIAKQEGDVRTSLDFHEKYAAADKRYLDDVGARELAFQMATHEATANRLQIDALAKQNQVLQLQRALGDKAVENGRLYIVLLVSTLIFMAALVYRTKRLQLHFKRLSQRDGLTGIFNRHHFIERAEIALEDCRKMGQSACVLLFDVDHFKAVNDKFGHAAGDAVLAAATAACKDKLDGNDIFGRLGGEEFGILISDATIEDGHRRAEQLRAVLADMPTRSGEAAIHISASFGVAATGQSGFELRQLMADADAALYRAKNAGRNRVVVFASTEPYVVLN